MEKLSITSLVPEKDDKAMIDRVLNMPNNPLDEPGGWSEKRYARKELSELSPAEVLVYQVVRAGRVFNEPHPPQEAEEIKQDLKKKTIDFLKSGRDDPEVSLLKAALVAECLPEKDEESNIDQQAYQTEDIKNWLKSLRGNEPIFSEDSEKDNQSREKISTYFGLTGDASTYAEIAEEYGYSKNWTRKKLINRSLGRLRQRYGKLINGTFESLIVREELKKI